MVMMRMRSALNVSIFSVIGLLSSVAYGGPITDNKAIDVSGYHTDISPGLELLISQSILHKELKETLSLLDNEIKKDPANTSLLYKKASIYADQGAWKNALEELDKINVLQPNNEAANRLRKIVVEKKQLEPQNELGFDLDEAYVSDLASYWNYSSIHYYRLNDNGKFGGHINYAHRYGTTGKQFLLEAYPQLSKNIFATINLGYANTVQTLFPNIQYLLEGYIDVDHGFEFSLGQGGEKFIDFSNQTIFNYTGTIGKYIGNSFVWFRPHHYTPKNTEFYELGIRQYFSDINNYIAFIVGAGKLPDIGDLPPSDQMIVINQKGLGINGQFSLTKTVFLKYGVGYVKQRFPSALNREITDVSMGIVWRV
jgi:YaiO family outer membrane protein